MQCPVGFSAVPCVVFSSVLCGFLQYPVGFSVVPCAVFCSALWGFLRCPVGFSAVSCGVFCSAQWGFLQCPVSFSLTALGRERFVTQQQKVCSRGPRQVPLRSGAWDRFYPSLWCGVCGMCQHHCRQITASSRRQPTCIYIYIP